MLTQRHDPFSELLILIGIYVREPNSTNQTNLVRLACQHIALFFSENDQLANSIFGHTITLLSCNFPERFQSLCIGLCSEFVAEEVNPIYNLFLHGRKNEARILGRKLIRAMFDDSLTKEAYLRIYLQPFKFLIDSTPPALNEADFIGHLLAKLAWPGFIPLITVILFLPTAKVIRIFDALRVSMANNRMFLPQLEQYLLSPNDMNETPFHYAIQHKPGVVPYYLAMLSTCTSTTKLIAFHKTATLLKDTYLDWIEAHADKLMLKIYLEYLETNFGQSLAHEILFEQTKTRHSARLLEKPAAIKNTVTEWLLRLRSYPDFNSGIDSFLKKQLDEKTTVAPLWGNAPKQRHQSQFFSARTFEEKRANKTSLPTPKAYSMTS